MSIDSARASSRTRKITSRKRRSGFTTVVGTAILIAAVSILGSFMVIWANTTLNGQRQTIGNDYERNSNILKERYIIEDVWLSRSPANYVNITLNNIGDVAIDVKSVRIIGLDSNGVSISEVTASPPFDGEGPPGEQHYSLPEDSNGVIGIKQILRVDLNYEWDDPDIQTLDISIMTERGSMERILWRAQ
ncbi:MAG: hypothetical protein QXU32_00230 [Nitrososphaerales archaeon]